jgi:hypothetical protein
MVWWRANGGGGGDGAMGRDGAMEKEPMGSIKL